MKRFFDIFLHELGFENAGQFARAIFGYKSLLMALLQFSTSLFVVTSDFIKTWVWDPPSGAFLIFGMVMAESLLGTWVAIKVNKEKFDYPKFYNILPKCVAHIGFLMLAFQIGKHSMVLAWLPSACFAWFASRNFFGMVLYAIQAKWVKGEFADFLQKKFAIENKEIGETIKNDIQR